MDTSTVGNQNPWAPYESYRRDCAQGICSTYCPQWCYGIFPPPPFIIGNDDDGGSTFSPLIIAIIGLLVSAFLLLCYFAIIRKYCRRRNNSVISTANHNEINHDQWQDVTQTGLDDMTIKSITVCKYKKGDGLIEGTECAVCLSEFQENENLRLLPKCTHAFHLPCIDTWLKANTNCPLCRSTATPTPAPNPQSSSNLSISSLQMQRENDLVLIFEDGGVDGRRGEGGFSRLAHGNHPKENIIESSISEAMGRNASGTDQENVAHFMRSISLGTFSSERHLSIADILRIDEDGDMEIENLGSQEGIISSSEGPLREQRKLIKSTT